jgi:hypothetical protein
VMRAACSSLITEGSMRVGLATNISRLGYLRPFPCGNQSRYVVCLTNPRNTAHSFPPNGRCRSLNSGANYAG